MQNELELIRFSHVTAGYKHNLVLNDVNFSICAHDFLLLSGPNGGGKTTLVRLINGLLKPFDGEILRRKNLRLGYQPQYQRIDKQFPLTVGQLVLTGLQSDISFWKSFKAHHYKLLEQTLERVELSSLANTLVSQLSGGQLQRALFARAIVSQPDLLVLDEPDTYLDARHKDFLYRTLTEQHCAIVMVSHDKYVHDELAYKCLEIVDGNVFQK